MIGRDMNPSATVCISGRMMTVKMPPATRIRPSVRREGKRSAVSPPR